MKYVASINDEALGEDTPGDFEMQYVDIGNVDSAGAIHELASYTFDAAPSRARRRVRDGDVIVSTVRTYLQAIAQIAAPPDNLIVSTGFAVVRPQRDRFDAGYCRFALRDPAFLAEVERRSTGVSYPAINAHELGNIPVVVPAPAEQRAIADYLDRETARIDALIAAKERVLDLLAERRRALIARAVTRGLDPNAPLRDSGIPWLGEIPAHWTIVALRFLTDLTSGATPDTGRAEYWDGDIPWVSAKDMKRDEIADAQDHVSERAISEGHLRLIAPGAVLVVVRGMILSHSFPAAIAKVALTINQDLKALCCGAALAPDFLHAFLRGHEGQVVSLADASAHGTRKLETEVFGRLPIALPPKDEQRAIVAYVREATSRLDAVRSAMESTIALLRERRATLIAAAVTGLIDVEATA